MNNILILGKGYIGTFLYNYLKDKGLKVKLLSKTDINYNDYYIFSNYLLFEKPSYVINCSGFTGIPNIDQAEELKDQCWFFNTQGPVNTNRACRSKRVNYIHLSSGCVYSGYSKRFTEEDTPNFGLFNESSFYSKSKHAYETLAGDYGMTVRIRMPYCSLTNERSYLNKILKFNKLLDIVNSRTSLHDLSSFLYYFIDNSFRPNYFGILNFTSKEPLLPTQIISLVEDYGKLPEGRDSSLVQITRELGQKAPRSNCILSTDKLERLLPKYKVSTELESLKYLLSKE
jgi:dTDP-4-dehydrorhamnose reductase